MIRRPRPAARLPSASGTRDAAVQVQAPARPGAPRPNPAARPA